MSFKLEFVYSTYSPILRCIRYGPISPLMDIQDLIKPFKDKHSIKEAVLTVFLDNQINFPSRFQKLIEGDLKEKFQQFSTVSEVSFELKSKGSEMDARKNREHETGFIFKGFEEGNLQYVLQGQNERDRNFISYHSLNYKRWGPFINDFQDCLSSIHTVQQELIVKSIVLHYIDEFEWVSDFKVEFIEEVFKKNNEYLPLKFYSSTNSNYVFLFEMDLNGQKYLDRLNVRLDSAIVNISHNVSLPLEEKRELADILKDSTLDDVLNLAHKRNKDLLHDLLSEKTCEIINLK